MRYILSILLGMLLLSGRPASAAPPEEHPGSDRNCRTHDKKMDGGSPAWCNTGDGSCSPEMRGRCGKRRGDWYGASQPVKTAQEAQQLLKGYFAGRPYTVSDIAEKKWGFKAAILDQSGTVIDTVMIDKRSGRIRSIY
jgi:hypothetical protein